jgi:alpha-1,6-mannosyltransferase
VILMSVHKKAITAGIFLSLIWAAVSAISRGIFVESGFYYDVPNKDMPTVIFLILFSIAFFIYFVISFGISKKKADRRTFIAIIFFACFFRIILLPGIPVHENDIYRYMWDGKVALSGTNPYAHAPQDAEIKPENKNRAKDFAKLKSLRDSNRAYFFRIGHRWVPTIYPPVAQAVFSLASFILQDSIFVLKSIFVIFDILAIFILSKLLRFFNKDPSLCVIYAWSPLVLKEVANSGHYDSVPICLLLLAIYLLLKGKASGSLSFALAAASKFFPILLLPLYRTMIKKRYYVLIGVVLAGIYTPFFFWQNIGIRQVFKGLIIYSDKWAYNGSIFAVIASILNMLQIQFLNNLFLPKVIVCLLFVISWVVLSLRKTSDEFSVLHNSFIIMALLFLLSPVADPWYFCWVIPFLCFFPYWSFIALSWLLIFSYLSFSRSFGSFSMEALELPILNMIQYVPFYILLAIEIIIRRKKRGSLSYVQKQ